MQHAKKQTRALWWRNMKITQALNLPIPAIVAVVGCGGKTSLIKRLAADLQSEKVLISPTTKMFPPGVQNADCRGIYNHRTGKLEALPPDELAGLVPNYGVVPLEADGSRSLPCKGWLENEPAVPGYCTHTIGVVTMNALGKQASGAAVHNLPQFLALTGLCEGEPITMNALKDMVCAPQGMFKNSVGQRFLIVNQVEVSETERAARDFLSAIKAGHPGFFAGMLLGSIYQDTWQEV